MIAKALTTFKDMIAKQPTLEIGGRIYALDGYHPVKAPEIEMFEIHTLIGIVDLASAYVDCHGDDVGLHVHIASPTEVFLETENKGPFRQKDIIARSRAYTTGFHFGEKYEIEEFIIQLNSQFLPTVDRDAILQLVSVITKDTTGSIKDTGITQRLEVKQGVSMRDQVEIKNPFILQPYRTFSEVDQPASEFIFRVHDGDKVRCSLHEADGSQWKLNAIEQIKGFFNVAMPSVLAFA